VSPCRRTSGSPSPTLPGEQAYPVSSFTWILLDQAQKDAAKGAALVDFLWWAVHDGQQLSGGLGYAPLPAPVVMQVEGALKSITAGGKPALSK
jgi:phosphate transport system substrate-binding protein